MAQIDDLLEAERRGILPQDLLSDLQEARKRGLAPAALAAGAPVQPQPPAASQAAPAPKQAEMSARDPTLSEREPTPQACRRGTGAALSRQSKRPSGSCKGPRSLIRASNRALRMVRPTSRAPAGQRRTWLAEPSAAWRRASMRHCADGRKSARRSGKPPAKIPARSIGRAQPEMSARP